MATSLVRSASRALVARSLGRGVACGMGFPCSALDAQGTVAIDP